MRKILVSLLFAAQALAQYPQITTQGPARPTMQVGSTLSNIGTATSYTGTGSPGSIATSVIGDLYIDTLSHSFYVCVNGNAPCTTWQFSSSPALVSVTSFGVNGSSVTDPGNFQTALGAIGGSASCLYIPGGVTVNLSTDTGTHALFSNTCITGNGPSSVIRASSTQIPLSIALGNIQISNLAIQGACTTPAGILYSAAISNGPAWGTLVAASSIFITGNISNVDIHDVLINHTCGYAVYADNTSGDISNISLKRVSVTNSRPFLFGNNASFEVYGAWTGGFFFFGPGTSHTYQNISVDQCLFQNLVGIAAWTHNNTITTTSLNKGIRFTNNTCIDTGLDCLQAGAIDGYTETGNTSIRNGYVITSDIGASRVGGPAWLQGFSPVSFDTSGFVINAVRSGNVAETENGEGIDGDGLGMSTISNNVVTSCFVSTDPLATPALCGPYNNPSSPLCPGAGICAGSGVGQNNFTRGMSTSNSNNITTNVGTGLAILGNQFNGVGGGGIQSFGINNSLISGNLIQQPANYSYYNPIVLGNLGTSQFQHSNNNFVTSNTILWSPVSGTPAVIEDSTSAGSCSTGPNCPFFSTDVNYVRGNTLFGVNLFEFTKGTPDFSGTGALTLSSVTPGAGTVTATVLQTEGPTANPSLRLYANNGAGTLLGGFNTGGFQPIKYVFGSLPLASAFQGSVIYCTDCAVTNPCTGSGSGALASSNGGTWNCGSTSGGGGTVTGSGTTAQITSWTGSSSVGNSGLSVSGGVLNTPSGILSSSGVTATGFNPTGFTGSTINLQVGCTISGGNCTAVFFAVPGAGALACPAGGPSNCTYYQSADITGGVVRGVH